MTSATEPGCESVELLFPEWVQNPDRPGDPDPRWAVQLDGVTVQHCETRREAEAYAAILRDVVSAVGSGQAAVLL